MKTLIIYNSKTGFTERYARYVANETNSNIVDFKHFKKENLDNYDSVIYAGSISAGLLFGLDKVKHKNLAVLAVGFSLKSDELLAKLKTDNKITGPLFYARGGINYEKLGWFKRTILKKVTKEEASVDCVDFKYVDDLIDYIKKIS